MTGREERRLSFYGLFPFFPQHLTSSAGKCKRVDRSQKKETKKSMAGNERDIGVDGRTRAIFSFLAFVVIRAANLWGSAVLPL